MSNEGTTNKKESVMYPLHEEERKAAPKAFLLSINEAKRIMRAASVMMPILYSYINVKEDQIKTPEMQAQLRQEILSAFTSKRISSESLLKVCNKIRNSKYWTYHISAIIIGKNAPDDNQFEYEIQSNVDWLFSNDATITKAKYPDFYKKNNSIADIADILGIPSDVFYIGELELHYSENIYRVVSKTAQEPIKEDPLFITVKSSNIIDSLSIITKSDIKDPAILRSKNEEGLITDVFEITAANGVKLSIDAGKFDELAIMSPATDKLKTLLEHYTLANGYHSNRFYLTLKQYMAALGLKDRKEAVKKFRTGAELIHAIRITAESQDGTEFKGRSLVQELDFITGRGQQGTYITGKWSDAYLEHLARTREQAQMPKAILTIPDNRRNEYRFAKTLFLHKRRNIGKENENRMRVSTLLDVSTLPRYDSIPKAQAGQKIIEPFIRSMDVLEELGILSWEFRYSKSVAKDDKLTDQDLNTLFTDYELFSSLLVEVSWIIQPDYNNLLEHKRQREARALQAGNRRRGRPKKEPVKKKS